MLNIQLLVKDEEELLPDLLSRLRLYVNASSIIVVDTGSKDRTVQIARDARCTVICTALNMDFARARNLGLQQVNHPWQLQIDADEMPDCALMTWADAWARLDHDYYGGVRIRRENLIDGQPIGDRTWEWHLRLFRRYYRYVGAIHERVMVPDDLVVHAPKDLILRHHKTGARQDRQNQFYQAWPEQRAIVGGSR